MTAKTVSLACRLAGRQGAVIAGAAALKIDPDLLEEFSEQIKGGIYAVCGTNGKTTVNNLLCSALEAEGKTVVCNHTGANMRSGIAAAFALNAGWNGRLKADCACIETDEAYAVQIFPHIKPDKMILTNLFRDQLDRYGEIDITMDLLMKAIRTAPDMELIVNGDDSLSVYLAQESGNAYRTYGISERVFDQKETGEIREGRFCKKCGARLEYDFYHYSQMGVWRCSECDFKRPEISYDASGIDMKDGLSFTVEGERIHTDYRGFYNIYNMLAVWGALRSSGCSTEHFKETLANYHPENGRNEVFRIGETKVLLNLAKNPAGFNQNISAVMEDPEEKDLIIVINDQVQDGRDVSWLWDVDFDRFKDDSVRSVTVSGIRGLDMALRLKYTDIESSVAKDVKSAISEALQNGSRNLYVLVNYSALFETHGILKEMEKRS